MITPLRRLAILAGLLLVAAPATAHVHVSAPSTVSAGTAATFTVGVPNERPDAVTVKVSLRVPAEFTEVQPLEEDGWTRAETTDGDDTVVTWEGGRISGADRAEFRFRAVPRTAGRFAIPAVQTYDDGTVVRWIGAGNDEYPAPVVGVGAGTTTSEPEHTLTATSTTSTTRTAATAASDDSGISTGAYIVGGLITLAIIGGVLLALRRRSDDS